MAQEKTGAKAERGKQWTFAGIQMNTEQLAKVVSGDDDLAKRIAKSAESAATNARLDAIKPTLAKLSKALSTALASGKLTADDLPRLSVKLNDEGLAEMVYRASRSRSGDVDNRESLSNAKLARADVAGFTRPKDGKRKPLAILGGTIKEVSAMLDASGIAHYFNIEAAHRANGCWDTKAKARASTCKVKSHGDQSQRQVLASLAALTADGWMIDYAGSRKSQPVAQLATIASAEATDAEPAEAPKRRAAKKTAPKSGK